MEVKKKFKVQVNRYYSVCDIIEVEAETKEEAKEKAKELSDDKDYTGSLQLDEVQSEIITTQPMSLKVTNIKYDTDGHRINLPKEIEIAIPEDVEGFDEIEQYLSDEISNITGFCHKGFLIEGE